MWCERSRQRGVKAMSRLRDNSDFSRLFAAQVTSLVGSGVTSIALAALAYQLVGAEASTVVGFALTLRILAFVVLSPIAGVLADRVDRKRMLIAADLVRVGVMGAFPFITSVWQIYVLIFLVNAVTAFFTPTFEASIPELVGERLYTRAISLSRVATDLEMVGGPLLAGLLIAVVGIRWTFWFDALTYVVSAVLVWRSYVPRAPKPTAPFPWHGFSAELAHGTREFLREPSLRAALLLHFAEAAAGAAAIVATVVYVQSLLGRSETSFAVAMAAIGVGSSVAALTVARSSERAITHAAAHRWARRILLTGGVLLCIALLPGPLRPPYPVFLALWALNGAGQAMIAVASVRLLAENTPPVERGRVYAAHFALTHLCWLVTYPAAGILSGRIGVPWMFAVAGVTALLMTAVAASIRTTTAAHV